MQHDEFLASTTIRDDERLSLSTTIRDDERLSPPGVETSTTSYLRVDGKKFECFFLID